MEKLNIVKMAILPRLTYRFNIIPIKILHFFAEIEKLILKFIWKCKRLKIAKIIMEEKNPVGRLTLSDFSSIKLQ